MKKNKLYALIGLIFCSSMMPTSCNFNDKAKIAKFDYSSIINTYFSDVEFNDESSIYFSNADKYIEKIDNKEDFILFLTDDTCLGCHQFIPIKNEVFQENRILSFGIELDMYKLSNLPKLLNDTRPTTPTIYVINDGKVSKKLTESDQSKAFKDTKAFESLILDSISLTNIEILNSVELYTPIQTPTASVNYLTFTDKPITGKYTSLNSIKPEKDILGSFLFYIPFFDQNIKLLFENDLFEISSSYYKYSFYLLDYTNELNYSDKDPIYSYTGSIKVGTSNGIDKVVTLPSSKIVDEETGEIIKYYPMYFTNIKKDSTTNAYLGEINEYADIINFINLNK